MIGDGPLRAETLSLFQNIPASRITWAGERAPDRIAGELRDADLYCWPGCGEAYGLAYLEAEAAGIPVVAQDIAGVPEVVRNGETGILTPAGDIAAYADAIRALVRRSAKGSASLESRRGDSCWPSARLRLLPSASTKPWPTLSTTGRFPPMVADWSLLAQGTGPVVEEQGLRRAYGFATMMPLLRRKALDRLLALCDRYRGSARPGGHP